MHVLSLSCACANSLFFKKEMELSLIGLQNAGKTSLVNVVATGGFHEDMIPTVGFNMRKVTKGAVTIKLWDLGGQARGALRPRPACDSLPALGPPWRYRQLPAAALAHLVSELRHVAESRARACGPARLRSGLRATVAACAPQENETSSGQRVCKAWKIR